jgi:L-2-hydroxycarboxylate dehydrogenase (NAD+)
MTSEGELSEQRFSVPAQTLRSLVTDIFVAHGVPEGDAARVAECLVQADLRGVSSHGVGRIPIYTERLRRGLVNPTPNLVVEHSFTVAARVEGHNGLGFVVGTRAMAEAIELARTHGVGIAFAHRSTHFGMAASYLKQAVAEGLAAFVFTNASPAMPIWGGKNPFLGTSPFAFGAPSRRAEPIILDMALSVVARGKIRRAAQKGEPIPLGWALDPDGRPTTDAQKGYDGIVLPMGGPKGSGLSLMMEIMAGVMSGAAFGGAVRNQYFDFEEAQNVGHCFLALRPDLFMPMEDYEMRLRDLIDRSKANPKAEGFDEILIPGEPEARTEAARTRQGIPLDHEDLKALRSEAERASVALPPDMDGGS